MSEQLKKYSKPVGTKICISWTRNDWNEACTWAIEQYGLPDEKFTTHPSEDYMDFYFVDERDAIHFSLRWQ